jgi:hypothetical protein
MPTFTPPAITEVAPVSATHERYKNPLGNRLMRYYKPRSRGVAVFKLNDGTYRVQKQVPGLSVQVMEPYPPVPESQVVNDALAWSFYNGTATEYPLDHPVSIVYYGGTSYQVSSAEAAALVAAGFGNYIT